jgi:hypothetical protein
MKVLIGMLTVLVLMIGAPSVMAVSDAYMDGYRQGSHDFIHKFVGSLVENPTGNPNITEFVNGYNQALKDVQSGPYGAFGTLLTKKAMEYSDGWFAGANALAYNLTQSPMGHNSVSYTNGWYAGRYPSN